MIFEQLKALICEEMNVDASKITMDTSFVEDLDADSLDAVELIMAVEEKFGIEVNDEEAQSIHTVGDIVKILESKK